MRGIADAVAGYPSSWANMEEAPTDGRSPRRMRTVVYARDEQGRAVIVGTAPKSKLEQRGRQWWWHPTAKELNRLGFTPRLETELTCKVSIPVHRKWNTWWLMGHE